MPYYWSGLEGASSGQSACLSLLDWDFVALGGAAFYPGDVPGKAAPGLCVAFPAAQTARLVMVLGGRTGQAVAVSGSRGAWLMCGDPACENSLGWGEGKKNLYAVTLIIAEHL